MGHPSPEDRELVRRRPEGRRPVMYQKWRELLFVHWTFDPDEIQATLPPGLRVDTFEGRAYVGVVPFYMRDIRPRFCPPLPWISSFLELNLRTYVFEESSGTPGVWFYSLDANRRLAVRVARRCFYLPYFDARMAAWSDGGDLRVGYSSHRVGTPKELASEFRYRGAAHLEPPAVDSLEYFLIERYVLFSFDRARRVLYSGRVHHAPYPLQIAEVEQFSTSVIELAGLSVPDRQPDHTIFSHGVDVDVFAVERRS